MKKPIFYTLSFISILFLASCSEEAIDESRFGTLTGQVVAKGGNSPLANAKITSSPVSTTVFTDASGNFTIDAIQIGEYSVQAELADYQTAFQAADILEGKTVNLVFELDSINVDNLAPATPLLLSPEEGAENILMEAEFVWSSAANDEDSVEYTLELRNGETNEIVTYEEIKDTTFIVEDLIIGKNYFWQVTADDGVNELVKSALGGFATKGGSENRFFYVRNVDGNNVIYSGSEPLGNSEDEVDQNDLQLTGSGMSSYRPKKNSTVNKLAFLRSVGSETHLFVQNADGSGLAQVTGSVPVAGFRQGELEYTWYDGGSKFYYPNFNKLYSINADGSGNQLVYEVPEAVFISEVAVNPMNNLVAIKTNNTAGYSARIAIVDVTTGTEEQVVAEGGEGALGGLDFSPDGNRVLFTRDVSGVENPEYRQLDSRIFEYDLTADTATELETGKADGTNDLDPKYAPDGGSIIFTNVSNDGQSPASIYRTRPNANQDRELLFTSAVMPDWE